MTNTYDKQWVIDQIANHVVKYGIGYFNISIGQVRISTREIGYYDSNNRPHRLDNKPSRIVLDSNQWVVFWYVEGVNHRLDGPAVIGGIKGLEYTAWWINGYEVTYKIATWAHENDIDLDNLSEDDKVMIKLAWSDYSE